MVAAFRQADGETPIVLMGYYNPIYTYGAAAFVVDAKKAGVDGLIVVDLPPEEADELYMPAACGRHRSRSSSTAPTTDEARLPRVLAYARGFLYYVSITGVTGTRVRRRGGGGGGAGAHPPPHRAADRRRFRHPHAGAGGGRCRQCRRRRRRLGAGGRNRPQPRQRMARRSRSWSIVSSGWWRRWRRACGGPGPRARWMSWLTNVVRPKLRELVGAPREIPDNLWQTCPSCGQMLFHRDLEKKLHVCQHCGCHLRLGVSERLAMLLDEGWQPVELPKAPVDPLKFRDLKRYTERLKEAQARTGRTDALAVGCEDRSAVPPAVVVAMDFEFMGGSMGMGVGEAAPAAAERAVGEGAALIVVSASGGARMQEGILSLMQMARTTIAVEQVRAAGLPYIVVLADPTTGGVSASFAMLGDVTLAEPGAVIGFAGARVIEQTIRESLPEGFQRAEYLLEHGMVDIVVPRPQLRETLGRLLRLLRTCSRRPRLGGGEPPAAAGDRRDGERREAAAADRVA